MTEEKMYQEAINFLEVCKEDINLNVSVTLLQRKFRIGYISAAKIMERLENDGYVSEFDGSKPRTILK